MFSYTTFSEHPRSTSVAKTYYDEPTKVLVVQFTNGNEAAYRNVPLSVYKEMIHADSTGKYYNAWVKGSYSGVPAPFGPYVQRKVHSSSSTGNHVHASVTQNGSLPKGFKVSGVVTFDVTDILVHADSVSEAVAKFEKALREAVFDNGTVKSVDLDVSGVVKA